MPRNRGKFEEIIRAHDGHNLNVQLERAADALRLPDWDAKIATLSGGERRRVALCRLLLEKNQTCCCSTNRPTTLTPNPSPRLERFLHDFEGTVVAITHDRYFLDNVAGWILELDRGEGIPWEGNYSSGWSRKINVWRKKLLRKPHAANLSRKSSSGFAGARKAVSLRVKARLARFEELNNVEYQKRNETNELFIPPGSASGR